MSNITLLALQVIIANFCQFKDTTVNTEYKIDCLSYVANCAIIKEGTTNEKRIELCKDKWAVIAEKDWSYDKEKHK